MKFGVYARRFRLGVVGVPALGGAGAAGSTGITGSDVGRVSTPACSSSRRQVASSQRSAPMIHAAARAYTRQSSASLRSRIFCHSGWL
jgi:hypothetical protein